jgi:hypothetical protein
MVGDSGFKSVDSFIRAKRALHLRQRSSFAPRAHPSFAAKRHPSFAEGTLHLRSTFIHHARPR